MMRIAISADHAGYLLKEPLSKLLTTLGHEVLDLGGVNDPTDDYPDFAEALGIAIRDGRAQRGVLICGSGVGANIAVNKIPGVRASICHDSYSAHQGVEHDDMNVLVLGGRVIGVDLAQELVKVFVAAHFSGEARHQRRLNKVQAIESRFLSEN